MTFWNFSKYAFEIQTMNQPHTSHPFQIKQSKSDNYIFKSGSRIIAALDGISFSLTTFPCGILGNTNSRFDLLQSNKKINRYYFEKKQRREKQVYKDKNTSKRKLPQFFENSD